MNNLHTLYTNGQDVLRIVKYIHPTPSIDGHFILVAGNSGHVIATVRELLANWKQFNSEAAFADYLLYTEQHLLGVNSEETHKHMIEWTRARCLETGIHLATTVKYDNLARWFR